MRSVRLKGMDARVENVIYFCELHNLCSATKELLRVRSGRMEWLKRVVAKDSCVLR